MDELEFYDGAWTGQEIDAGIGLAGTLSNALAVVVDGNKAAVSAAVGQYVLVKNSTITGISDGLYEAAKALPANTTLDGTYFSSAVTAGGLNDLKAVLDAKATYTQDSLVDLGLAANGVIARTGNIITMYISSPTNPMTQNVSYNVGVLPNRYIPYGAMNGNYFVANGRDYYVTIVGGSITLNTPSVLPSTGIPSMQIYITWNAKYAI